MQRAEQKQRGLNDYNVMKAIRKLHAEVGMHSNFIYSLLDKDGSHYQGDLFARLFVKYVLEIDDFGKITDVEAEYDADGRRIDLVVKSDDYHIGIEMKIYAGDQPNQLYDYYDFLKNHSEKAKVKIFYLTLNGKEPSENSIISQDGDKKLSKDSYSTISFEKHILKWLYKSQYEVQNITNLNSAIGYYIDVVKELIGEYKSPVNQYKDFFLQKDIYECYHKTDNRVEDLKSFDIDEVDEIEEEFQIVKQLLLDDFYKNILRELINNNPSITYFRYAQNSSMQEVQLTLNQYYTINLFLDNNHTKFTSIKLAIAWAYNNEAKGDQVLKKILEKCGHTIANIEELTTMVFPKGKGVRLEVDEMIPQPTTDNLFLAQNNELMPISSTIIDEIQNHIDKVMDILEI